MKKMPIGILDANVEGLYILDSLTKEFKYEDFIYINDIKSAPYEGKDSEVILKHVKISVEKLLEYNIKLLVVISDTIVEYCEEYLKTLEIPVINIVSSIVNYVNNYYEQKNLIFCAKDYVIKANLYQKNFKYNRMYNVESDELENVIIQNKIKTSMSFKVAENLFKGVNQKGCDLLIITAPWIELLKTEIFEFLDVEKILKLGLVLTEEIKRSRIELNNRIKGKITIISDIDIKEFKELTKWFTLKYKYEKIENEISEKNGKQNTKI